MNCLRTGRSKKEKTTSQYATAEDFRKIFDERLHDLFQLAYLLAGDQEKAEQAFVSGLEESIRANSVFKNWAHAWAKRTIIQNVIRLLQPRPVDISSAPAPVLSKEYLSQFGAGHFDANTVLKLNDFERFVFVLTVLDQYTDHDCAVLLDSPLQLVRQARVQALEQLLSLANTAEESPQPTFDEPSAKPAV